MISLFLLLLSSVFATQCKYCSDAHGCCITDNFTCTTQDNTNLTLLSSNIGYLYFLTQEINGDSIQILTGYQGALPVAGGSYTNYAGWVTNGPVYASGTWLYSVNPQYICDLTTGKSCCDNSMACSLSGNISIVNMYSKCPSMYNIQIGNMYTFPLNTPIICMADMGTTYEQDFRIITSGAKSDNVVITCS